MKLLSNTPATKYTRASEFVQQIAEETKKLLDAGEAYQAEEDQLYQDMVWTHMANDGHNEYRVFRTWREPWR